MSDFLSVSVKLQAATIDVFALKTWLLQKLWGFLRNAQLLGARHWSRQPRLVCTKHPVSFKEPSVELY